MTFGRSLYDTWLVARFEVLRAIRTWRALALILAYFIANVGGAYLCVRALGEAENNLAEKMGVATTDYPGAMTAELMKSDNGRAFLEFIAGSETVVEYLVDDPPLALFQFFVSIGLIPFLAATAASEAVAIDVQSRAIRYEALRTGRAELVVGRLLGQGLLSVAATAIALGGVWVIGMTLMVQQDPFGLAWALLSLGIRAVMFAVPFAGLGIACSQLTTSPAWARILALGGTAGSWVVYMLLPLFEVTPWIYLKDALIPVLPQSWLASLWHPTEWIISALVCVSLGLVSMGLGYVRFSERDL